MNQCQKPESNIKKQRKTEKRTKKKKEEAERSILQWLD